ncbi:hypothetical protein QQZ08_001786 [Neonectria magnoliae]|uniref:Uncharacterized protein n=1 Tax=Neonectria magnoliae TaxID=2732573 RepID=A0ABR1IFD3_9HYPO
MFSTKVSGVFLLQGASLITGGLGLTVPSRGRCSGSCSSDDELVRLLSSEDNLPEAVPFCSSYLGIAASTEVATVTPTVLATITEIDHVTVVTTQVNTVTVTAISQAPAKRDESFPYPEWLPQSYPESRVSSACSCLRISASVLSNTVTAEAITQTTAVTVTLTDLSTLVATETAVVSPPRRLGIQAFRRDNGASMGYLYWSNGFAVGGTTASATPISFTLLNGQTYGEALRMTLASDPNAAIGSRFGNG